MANFQKTAGDKSTRLDKDSATLVLVVSEHVKIDLFDSSPGIPLIVDGDNTGLLSVSFNPISMSTSLATYSVMALNPGIAHITARRVDQLNQSYADNATPAQIAARRQAWLNAPVLASLEVSVFVDYAQAGGTWGSLTYGSTNPAWKNVKWTTMAEAGCGPTSLANVLDFLERLSPTAPSDVSYVAVSPKDTMTYTSTYGRAADDKGVPQGTSGKIMMDNISRYWPDYSARAVTTLDDAKQLVRSHKPIVFLAKNTVTWKYDGKGNKREVNWPGHFMVVIGYEGKGDPFWIADSSHAQTTFISADELKKCSMWVVTREKVNGIPLIDADALRNAMRNSCGPDD